MRVLLLGASDWVWRLVRAGVRRDIVVGSHQQLHERSPAFRSFDYVILANERSKVIAATLAWQHACETEKQKDARDANVETRFLRVIFCEDM